MKEDLMVGGYPRNEKGVGFGRSTIDVDSSHLHFLFKPPTILQFSSFLTLN